MTRNMLTFGFAAVVAMGSFALFAGTVYTYADPVWIVTVNATTNEIAEASFVKSVGGVETESDYNTFYAETSGTLVKRGSGVLLVEHSISNFLGEIHVESGVYYVHHPNGMGAFRGEKIFAHEGASVVMHMPTEYISRLPYNNENPDPLKRSFVFDGAGAASEGGALVIRDQKNSNIYNWHTLGGFCLSNDATVVVDDTTCYANWRPKVYYELNGHTLIMRGDRKLAADTPKYNNNGINFVGSSGSTLVVSNMNFTMQGSENGFNGDETSRFVLGDQALLIANGFRYWYRLWTIVFDPGFSRLNFNRSNATAPVDPLSTTHNWTGPAVLNTTVKLYNANGTTKHYDSFSFMGEVSGEGGFTTMDDQKERYQSDMILYLGADNTFKGGVHMNYSQLWLGSGGALPKDEKPLELGKGARLYLANVDDYELPALKVDGDASVAAVNPRTTGGFKSIEKKGAGTLDFEAYSLHSGTLEVKEGTFTLPTLSFSALAGLYGGMLTNKNTAAALNYLNGRQTITNTITMRAEGAYHYGTDEYGWHQYADITYEGYIWNTNSTDVTWTFAANIDGGYRLFIDNEEVLPYTGYRWTPTCTNVTLTPGPHAFELRMCGGGGGEFGATKRVCDPENKGRARDVSNDWKWVEKNGFMYDTQARESHNVADYTIPTDDGSGTLFTVSTNLSDLAEYLPTFGTMKFAAGTTFDLSGQHYVAGNLEGLPQVTNGGSLTITNAWTVSLTNVAENTMAVAGKLKFGPKAKLQLTDEHKLTGEFTIATSTEPIEGFPTLVDPVGGHRNYSLVPSDDGKALKLKVVGSGIIIMVN